MNRQISASAHAAPALSVVVPVYNSANTLEPLVARIATVLGDYAPAWEIILVDDGSTDASWETVTRLASSAQHCRGFRLMRNYGQHNALLAGIRHARYDTTVTIDDDLQNPPEEIPVLVNELSVGVDVVYGAPLGAAHGSARRLSSRITKLALKGVLGAEVATKISAFRAFRTHLRAGFADVRGPTVNIDVLLSWSTTNYRAVRVRHDERAAGASNYTRRQLVRHALNMLTGFSTMPLRLASFVGFGFTLVGMGILTYVVIRYLQSGGVVPGFAFLASMVAIFSGAQLFTIGIIGEYLARMYHRMTERPSYVVGESTSGVDAR
jgi:glycosyltransferase involved in cell wall biosynthesis